MSELKILRISSIYLALKVLMPNIIRLALVRFCNTHHEQFSTLKCLISSMVESNFSERPFSRVRSTDPVQFRVSAIGEGNCTLASYNRRDFYKLTLVNKGTSNLLYANRGIEISQPALVFTNPLVPYSWEGGGESDTCGYFCVFSDGFLQVNGRMKSLQESSLFKAGNYPVFLLSAGQAEYINSIFTRMRAEFDSDYVYKYDVIRNQLNLIFHEAIRMQPTEAYFTPPNAAARITRLFTTLLEKQFPVDSLPQSLQLKTAGDYAKSLAIHVNHLNAAVQEITGKSTTAHISEKMLHEAKSMLAHTDLTVAEVAYSLGFEYPSYFTTFFKKHTGATPRAMRNRQGV